jgi:hypothetical protein
LHPQKFGCTPKNEGKRVHVPPDEKTCGHAVSADVYTAIVRPTVEYASTVWDPSNPKKEQIHRTGTEKSIKNCAQQLHRPNTRLCHKYGKIFKMGKPADKS